MPPTGHPATGQPSTTPAPAPDESSGPGRRRPTTSRTAIVAIGVPMLLASCTATAVDDPAATGADDAAAVVPVAATDIDLETLIASGRTLDGSGNNLDDPTLGAAGLVYPREVEANYADGVGEPVDSPDARYLSNRIFNDTNQNIFTDSGVTHWGFVWGQFIDHTIGLRESGDESMDIEFDPTDPLEDFTNDLGAISMTRTAVADGTGIDTPREQVNTISSYIDAWAVYGGDEERLDWLREGVVDGDPTNNDATLMTEDGYLPTGEARPRHRDTGGRSDGSALRRPHRSRRRGRRARQREHRPDGRADPLRA